MTNYIDENELENLKLEFALLNKDGKISKEEFKNLFQGSNYTEKEIEGFVIIFFFNL
jgi:Ca2+-binding EF-hand superfamily protein